MRQAVVTFGSDPFAEQGLRFEVFREAGVVDVEILSCEGSRGVLRVHVEEPIDPDRLDAMGAVQRWERVASEGSAHVYLLEAGGVEVGDSTPGDERFPRCEQVRVTDRGITMTWAGPQHRLREALAHLDRVGEDVSLETLRRYRARSGPLDALTDRQQEVLEVAFQRGYYDVPRRTSVRGIAAEFDLDDSTVAEHLQRAERNLLRTLFGGAR